MFEELERRRAEVERHRENRARIASAFGKFRTVGQGFIEFEEVLDFGLAFAEEPIVAYGTAMDLDDLGERLELEADEPVPVPLCTGMVTEWDMDDRGFYVGAWVGARVWFPAGEVPVDLNVVVEHYFTFTAIGIKDFPMEARN